MIPKTLVAKYKCFLLNSYEWQAEIVIEDRQVIKIHCPFYDPENHTCSYIDENQSPVFAISPAFPPCVFYEELKDDSQ